MAKGKGGGLLLAGLAVGAYTYFKNPENREKATLAFNNAKEKVNSYMESQNLDNDKKTAFEGSNTEESNENTIEAEGVPNNSVQYYNEDEQQEESRAKLSPNDTSKEKAENTESVSPEPRIGTDNI